jgi:hypothetical protein
MIAGMSCKPFSDLSWTLIYRYYPPSYHDFWCQALGANSENANEMGLFMGMTGQLTRIMSVQVYADIFRFPWLKYTVSAPSFGQEYSFQVSCQLSDNTMMYFIYRRKCTLADHQEPSLVIDQPEELLKDHFRFNLAYTLMHFLKLQSRMERSCYGRSGDTKTNGYLFFQELSFNARKKKLGITFRYALFDTETHDDRIYAYESDVLSASSAPAFYDRGTRILLLTRLGIGKNMDLWIRLTRTDYLGKTSVGSGLDEIRGPAKTDIKLQIRWRL